MLEHFPLVKGPKSDPQLVWSFGDDEIILKGLESSMDTAGMNVSHFRYHWLTRLIVKGQLATELTISSGEFDVYDIYEPPITIAFHLREFLVSHVLITTASFLMSGRRQ